LGVVGEVRAPPTHCRLAKSGRVMRVPWTLTDLWTCLTLARPGREVMGNTAVVAASIRLFPTFRAPFTWTREDRNEGAIVPVHVPGVNVTDSEPMLLMSPSPSVVRNP
jgi:hypothetical protein